jgi:hypothetical protein
VGLDGSPLVVTPFFSDNGNKTYTSTGNFATANWAFNWNMTVNPDPFISAIFSFVNNTAFVQSFTVAVSLPIIPTGPLTLFGGSIGFSLTDSNFNGFAQLTDVGAGVGVYQGQSDGVTVLELLDDPFTVTANLFPGQTVTASDVDGLPGPTLPGPAAKSTIGIIHRFRLTPGDSVAFTSFYVVEAIPEVGSVAMMGGVMTVLASVAAVRRRRKTC